MKFARILFSGFLLLTIKPATAQVFTYQGALTETNGEAMTDQMIDLRITFFQDDQPLFTEEHLGIATSNRGVFKINVGFNRLSNFFNIGF